MTRSLWNLLLVGLVTLILGLGVANRAEAWEPFRSESPDVRRGNEHLQKGQAAEALEAYETAARKLPKDAAVQLNRGLALMATDKLDAAREAFKQATQGSASKEVRAQSYYDMGLAFMQQADTAAKADKLDEAQGFLRESVDAFKSSLRNGPKNRDAAWNLELAKRRLVDVEKKQEEKKKQEEEQKKNEDEQKQDDQQKQDEQKQDDQQKQDEQKQDENKPGDEKKPSDEQKDPNQPKPEGENKEPPKPEPQQGQDGKEEDAPQEQAMPKPMQQALDALSHGEENLEKVRARMRAARQPQRVEKDW